MPTKPQQAARYQKLPRFLRKLREEAGLTQRALADKLGVTHVSIHKSETAERRVDVTEFIDWCLACGAEPEEALGRLRKRRGC